MNCLRQIRRWLVLTLLLSAALSAQVYRINAGSTDQYDASGGSIEVTGGAQWLWLDDMLQLGISDAVAEWLAGGRT